MSAETVVPLPRSWVGAELREIVEVNYGKALPERHRDATGSYPVVGSSGVVGKHSCAVAHGPCLVIGRKGAAGSVHYINRSCWPIDTAYFMQPPAEVDITFLRHFLASERLVQLEKSTAVPSLSRDDLYDVKVPLAPLPEQVRIGAKLEELFSDLEAAVAELEAAGRKLTQYRQSLLKAAVEGDLTAEWRASNPPQKTGAELLTRILRERRARWEAQLGMRRKYLEPTGVDPSGAANLPSGWCWASIDELADIGTGVTPLRTDSRYFDGGTVPWVTSGALNAERVLEPSSLVTEVALEECRLVMYPAGSLLVAMYGEGKTRGKCAELGIAATINQAIAALVFKGFAVACREYVKAFLWHSYERMRQQASGGVQPNLNLQIIKTLAVPLPPLAEQETIVLALNAQLEAMREHEAAIARGLRMAAAQRQNILRAAFSGQLVPQDPNDEPASVLLERIRIERLGGDHAASPSIKSRRRRGKQSPSSERQRESTIS